VFSSLLKPPMFYAYISGPEHWSMNYTVSLVFNILHWKMLFRPTTLFAYTAELQSSVTHWWFIIKHVHLSKSARSLLTLALFSQLLLNQWNVDLKCERWKEDFVFNEKTYSKPLNVTLVVYLSPFHSFPSFSPLVKHTYWDN